MSGVSAIIFKDSCGIEHEFKPNSVKTYCREDQNNHSRVYLIMHDDTVREMFMEHQGLCNFIDKCSSIMMKTSEPVDIGKIISEYKEAL